MKCVKRTVHNVQEGVGWGEGEEGRGQRVHHWAGEAGRVGSGQGGGVRGQRVACIIFYGVAGMAMMLML